MMRVLDNITDAVIRRVPIKRPLMSFTEDVSAVPAMSLDHHIRLHIELKLRMDMTGPVEETGEMRRRAARMFVHELYAEVADDLMEVLRLLYEEGHYRAPDDPVMVKLNGLLDKLRGNGI